MGTVLLAFYLSAIVSGALALSWKICKAINSWRVEHKTNRRYG